MKYVIKTHSGMIGVHDSGAVAYRAGERTQEFTVIGEQVTSFFTDRAADLINEEFFDYQNDNDIDDGGLPPELDNEITEAFERLCDVIGKCKAWQLANAQDEQSNAIYDVRTIYTGGGIFQYIVALSGDRWAMFDDEDLGRAFVPVVDREPTSDDWHSEFFEAHDAGYLVDDEANDFMRRVLKEADLNPADLSDRLARI